MSGLRKNRLLSIILAVVILIEGLFTSINPMYAGAAENYRLWRQWDKRWGDIYLGTSPDTMARSGCLVTSIAILAVHSGTKDPETFNPGTLANELNNVGAFNMWGGIASWAKVTEIIPEIRFIKAVQFSSNKQIDKANEMLSVMQQGYHVVCNVGGHWVYVESIDGEDVYMIDPAKDEINMFEAYPNGNITAFQAYTGKNPPENIIPPTDSDTNTTTSTTTTSTTTSTTTTSTTTSTTTTSTTTSTTTTSTTMSTTTTSSNTTTTTTLIQEYYNLSDSNIGIFSSSKDGDIIGALKKGYVVNITKIENGRGCIIFKNGVGWIDINHLTYAGKPKEHKKGDINNDGEVNFYDLSILNEYLKSLNELPYGISMLRDCEIKAADLNTDGEINNYDVKKYLALICG